MNTGIGEILKGYISTLNFADKVAGVVRPVIQVDVIEQYDEDNKLIGTVTQRKVFPVACGVTHKQCYEEGLLTDLVPNSSNRSIMYFEDNGCVLTGVEGKLQRYKSSIRLVGWLNLQQFDTSSCTISAEVIAAIIKVIPTGIFNAAGTNYQRVQIRLRNIVPKSQAIFGSYTYNEETTQYLMYPYDYFALDLEVDFAIHENCIQDVSIKEADCEPT